MKEAWRQIRTATESLAARPPLPYIVALPGYPSPSAPLRTDRGSLRLNRSRALNIGHCNLLSFSPRPYTTAIVEVFCCKDNPYLFSQSEQDEKNLFFLFLSLSAPTCKVSQERISFDASIIRIILLPYVTFGDCNLIVIPIEHLKTRFIRNFIL